MNLVFSLKHFQRAIRVYQWTKNSLLFVPYVLVAAISKKNLDQSIIAFFSFSLVASAGYIFNDALDKSADQKHKSKKNRPIALGIIKLTTAYYMAFILILCGISLSLMLNKYFSFSLIIYGVLSYTYSFWLKRYAYIDLFILGLCYLVRLIAGYLVIDLQAPSPLLAIAFTFFIGLASLKRYIEISDHSLINQKIERRGYKFQDSRKVLFIGLTTGFILPTFFLFETSIFELKWFLLLILMALGNLWYRAYKKNLDDDPLYSFLTDRFSYITLGVGLFLKIYS
ncbi:MAG: UbiA prenyltransferase family protein [Bacteriovoracaceae bacterium]